jgi:hypothetical protein
MSAIIRCPDIGTLCAVAIIPRPNIVTPQFCAVAIIPCPNIVTLCVTSYTQGLSPDEAAAEMSLGGKVHIAFCTS